MGYKEYIVYIQGSIGPLVPPCRAHREVRKIDSRV